MESIGLNPSAEALEDGIPRAKLFGSLATLRTCPHDPQNGFHEKTRIATGLAGVFRGSKAEGFDNRPMGIGQYTSGQGCTPAFATLKQKSDQMGHLNVNGPWVST